MARLTSSEEYIKHQLKGEVIDYDNPRCHNCNECCDVLAMIYPEEYVKLKKYLFKDKRGKLIYKQALEKFKARNSNRNTRDLRCPFSSKNKRCLIYDKRPMVCKEFHCKPELNTLDKNIIEPEEHRTLYDLFRYNMKR